MDQQEGKKILIVEDDKFIAEVYTTKLSSEGFVVSLADDGEDALKKLREEEIPDLVVLDILMPNKNGIEVLEEMQKDEKLKAVKVIVLTNANEREYVEKAMKKGVVEYLIKSNYTPDEVVSKIKTKIE